MSLRVILLIVLLTGVVGCDRPKKEQAQTRQKPASFGETFFTSVTPTADGGAYAVGFDSGLWYLRGSEAIKVQFSGLSTTNNNTFFITLDITPLVDGGAYAHSIMDRSFWHLREGNAQRVTEISSLSSRPLSGQFTGFAQYVAERQKRLEAEQELEDRPSLDEASPDQ